MRRAKGGRLLNRIDRKIKQMILAAFRLLRRELSEEAADSLTQFVKFCFVGVTNTAVSYAVNVLVLALLSPAQLKWDYVAGNVMTFLLSVLWSFYWNNKYVFTLKDGQKRSIFPALMKTYAAYALTGIVLNNLLSYVWIEQLHISKYVAPLLNLCFSIPLNFLINKKWAFRAE